MTEAWKRHDLHGEGLQQANLELARALRKRRTAYWLLLAFPVGAHRAYLYEPVGAWGYRAVSVAALALLALKPIWAFVPAGLLAAWLAFDVFWIERRLTSVNKQLRMRAYLRPSAGPAPGYRGRYHDVNEMSAERHPSPFAVQERKLAEIERQRRERG